MADRANVGVHSKATGLVFRPTVLGFLGTFAAGRIKSSPECYNVQIQFGRVINQPSSRNSQLADAFHRVAGFLFHAAITAL